MNDRSIIEAAVERILYPVIKLLIDCGVTQTHFSNIARRTFVKVASQKLEGEVADQRAVAEEAFKKTLLESGRSEEDILALEAEIDRLGGIKAALRKGLKAADMEQSEIEEAVERLPAIGRVTSTRIQLMTGVPRKDIPSLLSETVEDVVDDQWYQHRCGKVLSEWWRTAEYTDEKGRPIALLESDALAKLNGESVSFESLVRRGGKDLSHHALMDELLVTECIERQPDERIKVLKQRYERQGVGPQALAQASNRIYSMTESVFAKVREGADSSVDEGAVFTLQADPERIPIILNRLRKALANFLNSSQGVLKQNESKTGEEGPQLRIGVGAYVFRGDEMAESKMFASTNSEIKKVANE